MENPAPLPLPEDARAWFLARLEVLREMVESGAPMDTYEDSYDVKGRRVIGLEFLIFEDELLGAWGSRERVPMPGNRRYWPVRRR